MLKSVEGSRAVAEVVTLCRPDVVSAYPITPQTLIVEDLAEMVANGVLKAEYVNVESEHSAASVVLGSSATGARTYTATTSQGLLLMIEVLYNIAGLRLPVVMGGVNRAVSAPINIWNDCQDSVAARDSGWIQLYAEDNQEACDLHIQAYKIAEREDIQLPVMVCMDGFLITHSIEPVDIPSQDDVDRFLAPYRPNHYLTPKKPLTFGYLMGPDGYMETRYLMQDAMEKAKGVIEDVAKEFSKSFGRYNGGLVEGYRLDDAEVAFVSMGTAVGVIKETVDILREEGVKAGALKIRSYRPFPEEAIRETLQGVKRVAVIEKDISLGFSGALCSDIKAAILGSGYDVEIKGFIAGLGGREINQNTVRQALSLFEEGKEPIFLDLAESVKGRKHA
ncbi:MAG: transketolase C-terminal domain-containing protein [Thermodesulfobacteriota bacterium]